jgi:hypothetical protein
MDIDSDPLTDIEEYLRSIGGRWATIPAALTRSLREHQNEDGEGEEARAIEEARLQSYDHAVREFAKACKRLNG